MRPTNLQRTTLAYCTLALLAACGGGNESVGANDFAQRLAASPRPSEGALAVTPGATTASTQAASSAAITSAMVFDFAQANYGSLFPSAAAPDFTIEYEGKNFEVRGFVGDNYLGVANGEIWGLGPFTNGVLTKIGAVADYACLILPSSCVAEPPPAPPPPAPPPPPAAGPLNECTDAAMASLPTGSRIKLIYQYNGTITGEQSVESVIDGPGFSFEGQSAVQVTSTTSGTNTVSQNGLTISTSTTTEEKSYQQTASGGLVKTLGAFSTVTATSTTDAGVPGFPPITNTTTTQTKTVFNPATENTEYTLQLGQSLDKPVTLTVTTLVSPVPGIPPSTVTSTERFTFAAKETITLSTGRSFSTCRYTIGTVGSSDASTTWFLVGKGIPVKTQATAGNEVQTIEFKSGTYNGAAI